MAMRIFTCFAEKLILGIDFIVKFHVFEALTFYLWGIKLKVDVKIISIYSYFFADSNGKGFFYFVANGRNESAKSS